MLLQCAWLPVSGFAADEVSGEETEVVSVSAESTEPPELTDVETSNEGTTALAGNAEVNEGSVAEEIFGGVVVSRPKSLTGLIGKAEIDVLADPDRQYLNSIEANKLFEDDVITEIDETGLLDSINVGRSFSRESLAARERVEQSQAQSGQALALLLPSLKIRASRGEETSEPSAATDPVTDELLPFSRHTRTDVSFTAVQPLFDLPTFLDWRRRKVKEGAREEAYRISDGDTYVSTVNAYLSLVSSRLKADVSRDFEQRLEELLDYIEKRAGAGASSVADMSRVRARSQATESSRLEQESAHAAAGTEFVRLTNVVPQRVLIPELEDIGASLLPATFEEAVSVALKSNPEIAALNRELEAEEVDISAARGRFLPRVEAEYTDAYSDQAGGAPRSQRDKRAMLVMSWDLFAGGKDIKNLEERKAKYRELKYRLDDERRLVIKELASKYSSLLTTGKRITTGYEEMESISIAAEAMSQRMLSGNQSLLDLLTVFENYFKVRSRLIDLHVLEMNTVAELIRLTMGAPWPLPEDDGNSG